MKKTRFKVQYIVKKHYIHIKNKVKYFNSIDRKKHITGKFDEKISNKYVNNDNEYLVYKVSPNFTSLYKTEEQMESFNHELTTLYNIISRFEKMVLYKYDDISKIPFQKENDNEIINLHVIKQNELISKGNELLVPNYFMLLPISTSIDAAEIIGAIKRQVTKINIVEISTQDYDIFEDVVNLNYKFTDEDIEYDGEFLKIDEEYSKFLEIINYTSEEQYFTYLTNLTNYGGVDFQFSIYKVNKDMVKNKVDIAIGDVETDLDKATKASAITSKNNQLSGLLDLSRQLHDSESDIFKTRLIFKFRGNDKKIIDKDIDDFKVFFKNEFIFRNVFFENPLKMWSVNTKQSKVMYLNEEFQVDYKYLTTEMLGHTGIFNFKDLIDQNGMYLNESPYGRVVLNMNYTSSEKQRNVPNFLVTGITGGGKSTFVKDTILHNLNQNNMAISIDVQGDFVNLTEAIGGLNIDVSNNIKFNPLEVQNWGVFDQYESCITDHISFLKGFINMANNNSINNEKMIYIDLALKAFYDKLEISPATISYPKFSDFQEFLTTDSDYIEIEIYIKTLTQGSYSTYFNYSSTDIKMSEYSYINYDISKLAPEVQNIMLYIIFNKFKKSMNENRKYNSKKVKDFRRIYLIIDEAHRMLSNANVIEFVTTSNSEIVREARKFYAAVGYATQSILEMKKAQGIFEQITYRYFLKQDPMALKDISEMIGVPMMSLKKLPNCTNGEGLLIINKEVYDLKHEPHQELVDNYFSGGKTGV